MNLSLLVALTLLFASQSFADDTRFSTNLYAKFQKQACTKCHDFFEKSRNGLAFAGHSGRSVEMCIVCHSQSVTGFKHAEEWFAQPGLYTSGMDSRTSCETVKTALHASFKNSRLVKHQLEKHLFEDPRVLWGIEGATPQSGMLPSGKREQDLVTGGMELWEKQVKAWINGGMKCD